MVPTPRNYYEILGVARNATADEIHRAYRRLARQYHPDVSTEPDARARFDELSTAYDILHDHDRRASYDRQADVAIRGSTRRPRSTPGFRPAPPPRDVPRFIDDGLGRPARADPSRTAQRVVIMWNLPGRPQFVFRPLTRRWPDVSWWPW